MKHVLVIANLFHASPRVPGYTPYLNECGWHATILTPPVSPDDAYRLGFPQTFFETVTLLPVPYGDSIAAIKKIFFLFHLKKNESVTEQLKERLGLTSQLSIIDRLVRWYQALFTYPDAETPWKKPALKAAHDFLKKNHVDAIMSSFPYATSHTIAYLLAKKYAIPWIADFRDPWTENHAYPFPRWRKWFDRRLEIKLMRACQALIAASPSYAEKQSKLHQRKVTMIPNGFDPAILSLPAPPLTKTFSLTYTGMIYPGKQNPLPFLEALQEWLAENAIPRHDCEVRFFGRKLAWLDEHIHRLDLADIVRQYGSIPRSDILTRQRESRILLLFCWEDPHERGVFPGKTFEYLAAGRPILALGGSPEEDIKALIVQAGAGVPADDTASIKQRLSEWYKEFRKTGDIAYHGNKALIEQYSFRTMAQTFAEVYERACHRALLTNDHL